MRGVVVAPFGGGKTQTASELCRRLPGSVVCGWLTLVSNTDGRMRGKLRRMAVTVRHTRR
ncbi:hypothetical protein F3087_27005 [Nocardia colli]|uniref:Uncharacterized protein n=1 Tax=Nocardia colli TaxID=2545717 RepID=A0A5N0EB88_9NOCA|nr:hypothetical protein F3087_27005 [Nocardia colli]